MIDPKQVAFFRPHNLKRFKLTLFDRIGGTIEAAGGRYIRDDYSAVGKLPDDIIPVIGCSPQFRSMIQEWRARNRQFLYWDRGFLRRVFATWLPRGSDMGIPGGYYRWCRNSFQMTAVLDVPPDRWKALRLDNEVKPWRKGGRRIVVAHTLPDYWNLRGLPEDWSFRLAEQLKQYTDRPIFVRDKESKVPLSVELQDAHALVTHGSIAAVEAVVMGCPVFVDAESAAALVGKTDFADIENPIYPDRERWLWSLAYSQWNEAELCDGTLWRMIQ
jgi:hypothetical protein